MARSVPEWIGRNDDAMPGKLVRSRLRAKHNNCCWQCGSPFGPKNLAHCDHIIPLIDEGENRETNLQMICAQCHKIKTSAEAAERKKVRDRQESHFEARRPSKWQSRGFSKPVPQRTASRPLVRKSERTAT